MSQLPRSIKLKLVQPKIKCSGRDEVTCYYRGKVVFENENEKHILIKTRGYFQEIRFIEDECITEGYEDLKIV